MKKVFICCCILLSFQKLTAQDYCGCKNDIPILIYKKCVAVCGTLVEPSTEDNLTLTEVLIKDCKSNKILFDSRLSAWEKFLIVNKSDSLVLTSLQLIPDSSMEQLTFIPLSFKSVNVNVKKGNSRVLISPKHFIFKAPKLTSFQKVYLDKLCGELKFAATKGKSAYPLDEMSIYALFLGAIHDYNDSQELFVNLEKYFILDGAIAETKSEIPFEYIIERLNR